MRCWFISNRIDMEHALNELNSAGFLRAQISVVTKDADRDEQLVWWMSERVEDKAQAGAPIWAITGSMLGAIVAWWACILAVPGVAPVLAVGTSGTALA